MLDKTIQLMENGARFGRGIFAQRLGTISRAARILSTPTGILLSAAEIPAWKVGFLKRVFSVREKHPLGFGWRGASFFLRIERGRQLRGFRHQERGFLN